MILKILLTIAIGFVGLSPPVVAEAHEATLEIIGTSTVRDWKCAGSASLKVIDKGDVVLPMPQDFSGTIKAVVAVAVSVQELDCGNDEMTKHLRKALKAKEHPAISFLAKESAVNGNTATISGDLTIAGETRPITLNAILQRTPEGGKIHGEVAIDMRDFLVKPPSLMLGVMRVAPQVTIHYTAAIKWPK